MRLYQELRFSTNWNNKLSCDVFTTFRPHNPTKYQVGKRLSVMLNGKDLKDIEVMSVKTLKLHQVNEFITGIDTGYDVDAFKAMVMTMYKNKNIDFNTANWDFVLCKTLKNNVKPDTLTAKQMALQL